MKRIFFAGFIVFVAAARADTPLPSAKGTLWTYQMTQEFGEGVRPSEATDKIDAELSHWWNTLP
jgi:hypothetical protein